MLTKVHSKINAFFVAMTTMVVLSIDAGMAHAAETLGARAKSITGEVDSFKELALGLSILVGVIYLNSIRPWFLQPSGIVNNDVPLGEIKQAPQVLSPYDIVGASRYPYLI